MTSDRYTPSSKKVSCLMFDNNFGKCGPIFKILLPDDSWEHYLCTHHRSSSSPALCCYTTLWKSKIQKMLLTLTAPQQTVEMFMKTLWGLGLTFNSSQTVSEDCSHWLTNILKFVRRRLEWTAELIHLNVVASWRFFHYGHLRTVFVLPRLYFVRCTHIQVKSLVQYLCGRLHKTSQ